MSFQAEKQCVLDYYAALSSDADPAAVMARYTVDDYLWRGFYPFGELSQSDVSQRFWQPLKTSLTSLQRRQDIFFAGRNEIDNFDSVWVVSMGHLTGLFDQPWLDIQPTGKIAMLRYCEFNRVADGKIAETAMYFDIPHFMVQAGYQPFPNQNAAHLVQPGPQTHTGLLFEEQKAAVGEATLAVINRMISDLGQWQSGLPLEEELRLTWHEDMLWWGPEGVGATYTIPRYAKQHSAPFRAAFTNRSKTRHICRTAEGHYGGFFGWPNFTATLSGSFTGFEPTHRTGEFRVIDIYRRDGDKLAENWVFIDLLHFWKQQGIDLLADHTRG